MIKDIALRFLSEKADFSKGYVSHDEINKHYPISVNHKGKTWHRTGKQGHRHDSGEHAIEYQHRTDGMDARVWRTKSGKVHDE